MDNFQQIHAATQLTQLQALFLKMNNNEISETNIYIVL